MPPIADINDDLARAFVQLKPLRNGPPRDEVEKHQRARLHAAMIELVAARGYAKTSVDQISLRAGVSKRTLYNQFKSKEAFFLQTYGLVIRRAIRRVNDAYRAETEWTCQISRGSEVFIAYVVEQPQAARFALVEALGAGPKAVNAMATTSSVFERLIGSSFEAAPEKARVSPLVLKGIVGGVSRVVRQRLLDDCAEELPEHADELLGWMLAHHTNAAAGLPRASMVRASKQPARLAWDRPIESIEDEAERMLSSAVRLAARYGYAELTADAIVDHAGVSRAAFNDAFPGGVEDCFMLAYDRMGGEVAAYAAEAASQAQEWDRAVFATLTALLWRIADDPVFTRVAFVEVFSVGPASLLCRARLMQSFSDLLLQRSPVDERPSELVAEAIVGAVWELVHHYVVRGAARRLPELAYLAAYLVLVPTLGGERAIESLRCLAGRPAVASIEPRGRPAS
ncbi:MAG TPA: TetR/AcrR family transcriptional regulator [Solirubrobacteraceae bacterium]|jgi:AcrR family transcriptional regulator|nr:TetR/AcrR family transcriptional regulator [Solirubrobacteraceae bacterium]